MIALAGIPLLLGLGVALHARVLIKQDRERMARMSRALDNLNYL